MGGAKPWRRGLSAGSLRSCRITGTARVPVHRAPEDVLPSHARKTGLPTRFRHVRDRADATSRQSPICRRADCAPPECPAHRDQHANRKENFPSVRSTGRVWPIAPEHRPQFHRLALGPIREAPIGGRERHLYRRVNLACDHLG